MDAGTAPSADETIDAPGTATYSIVVTNVGTGIALNATLSDTLPAGSWTVTLSQTRTPTTSARSGGNPATGRFSCTFGDARPWCSKTVTGLPLGDDRGRLRRSPPEQRRWHHHLPGGRHRPERRQRRVVGHDPRPVPAIEIDLDKTGDTLAHVGDTVDYEFTVTNTGAEAW